MSDLSSTSIPWMNSSTISGMSNSADSDGQSNVASFMKSSYCVGSIVNVSLGGSTVELQRVASPSQCEFNYVSLDPELDPFAEEFKATHDTVCSPISISVCMLAFSRLNFRKFAFFRNFD